MGTCMVPICHVKCTHYCSPERVRQIVEELGLKHLPEDRKPEWRLIRKARRVGHLELADRQWLAEKITCYHSMARLAAELQVEDKDLLLFIREFDLSHPSFRKHGAQTVNLVCTKCGTKFARLRKWVDRRMKNAGGHQPEFFCDQSCAAQWNSERARMRIGEKPTKQLNANASKQREGST